MVKHIILWQLKDEITGSEKATIISNIKTNLEGLVGIVPGLISLTIQTEHLASSNADIMLDSTLESEGALKGYAIHPNHVAVANTFVRPFVKTRLCLDYNI